jgi:hypothetical protein
MNKASFLGTHTADFAAKHSYQRQAYARTFSIAERAENLEPEVAVNNLEGWQVSELRRAAALGRKKVEVRSQQLWSLSNVFLVTLPKDGFCNPAEVLQRI